MSSHEIRGQLMACLAASALSLPRGAQPKDVMERASQFSSWVDVFTQAREDEERERWETEDATRARASRNAAFDIAATGHRP